eukprot:scaffold187797_cov17-Tisochrysis_lutea.AAC.1
MRAELEQAPEVARGGADGAQPPPPHKKGVRPRSLTVVDVRNDAHVTDVLLLVHQRTDLCVQGEGHDEGPHGGCVVEGPSDLSEEGNSAAACWAGSGKCLPPRW